MKDIMKFPGNEEKESTQTAKSASQQIGLKIPVELLERCDVVAKKLGLNRSAFIKYAIAKAVETEGSFGR